MKSVMHQPQLNRLAADLDHVLVHTPGLWEELRGQRIFITGGTGFFGSWLLESFTWANKQLQLDAEAVVLSRNPAAFLNKVPHLADDPAIRWLVGDVCSFEFPASTFSHVIHAATESGKQAGNTAPLQMLDVIVSGTRRVLDFALKARARGFLLTSSGAVYGKQPSELSHLPETYVGAPDPLSSSSAYSEGKRLAELLCALYHKQHGLETKIARGFAFVGPYLPLDAHFAVGNFIGDALDGGSIEVKGDGTAQRSYLYAADLAVWLWTILLRGQACHPYNVGSEEAFSIAELAEEVRRIVNPSAAVRIAGRASLNSSAQRYVPSTERARTELGLRPVIGLTQSLQRTAAWHTEISETKS
jgi:dTDP-glucose 4,6-dehydratase